MSKLKINGEGSSTNKMSVLLDDVEISKKITSLKLELEAGKINKASIEFVADNIEVVVDEVDINAD